MPLPMKVVAKIVLWAVMGAALLRGAVLIYGFIKDAAVDAPSDLPKVWEWFSLFPQEAIALLVIALGAGALATHDSWWPALKRFAGVRDQHQSLTRVTRTAYDAIQSIKTLPTSLGGNDVLRLGTLATLRRRAPYSLEMVTLVLDAVPMHLPGRADDKITVEDLSVTTGHLVTYVFDTAENKRHEISVAGRTYIVTLLESKKLDTPNHSNPIEWVFGITEK